MRLPDVEMCLFHKARDELRWAWCLEASAVARAIAASLNVALFGIGEFILETIENSELIGYISCVNYVTSQCIVYTKTSLVAPLKPS